MSTRFSMDVPMDIEIFKSISLQAFDDYKRRTEDIPARISELDLEKVHDIDDEVASVNYLINEEAEKILLRRKIIICLVAAVLYLSPLLLAFNEYIYNNVFQGPVFIALLVMGGLIGYWWLWAVFNADSDVWKWVAGIFLFVSPVCWWAAIFCLILYFFVLNNNDTKKIKRSLARKPNNRKKLTKAKKDDKEATALKNQKIDAEIALLKREASKEGEYEWLRREWITAFSNSAELKHLVNCLPERWIADSPDGICRFFINDKGPDKRYPMFRRKQGYFWGIVYEDYETPNRYIEITIEASIKSAERMVEHYHQTRLNKNW